jgi:hypothetical protein
MRVESTTNAAGGSPPHRLRKQVVDRHRCDRGRLPPPDRRPLDITGARWGLQGAEAVLQLRTLTANGDLDAYWRCDSASEHYRQRLCPTPDQDDCDLTTTGRARSDRASLAPAALPDTGGTWTCPHVTAMLDL